VKASLRASIASGVYSEQKAVATSEAFTLGFYSLFKADATSEGFTLIG